MNCPSPSPFVFAGAFDLSVLARLAVAGRGSPARGDVGRRDEHPTWRVSTSRGGSHLGHADRR